MSRRCRWAATKADGQKFPPKTTFAEMRCLIKVCMRHWAVVWSQPQKWQSTLLHTFNFRISKHAHKFNLGIHSIDNASVYVHLYETIENLSTILHRKTTPTTNEFGNVWTMTIAFLLQHFSLKSWANGWRSAICHIHSGGDDQKGVSPSSRMPGRQAEAGRQPIIIITQINWGD